MASKTIQGDLCDLDTVYWLFNHTCDKNKKIIDEITKIIEGDLSKANKFYLLKVLLKLYERLCCNDKNSEINLPFCLILQFIEHSLNQENENDDVSNNHKDLLEIFSLLVTIVIVRMSEEGAHGILKFCEWNFNFLKSYDPSKSTNKTELCIRLKFLNAIHNTFISSVKSETNNDIKIFYMEEITSKLEETTEHSKVLADYALYGVDDVAAQTLLTLNLFVGSKFVKITWGEITRCMNFHSIPQIKYSRIYLILCYLFDLSKVNLEIKENWFSDWFNNSNFWKLIQFGLVEKDPVIKKQAMYLFKSSLNVLDTVNIFIEKDACDSIFLWDVNLKNELHSIYTEIITILEFLDEQQVHIIKPIFQEVESLIQKMSKNSINFSWIILIHKKALMHENTQVVKWGLINLLKLPDNFYSDVLTSAVIAGLLISTLNNINLYYNDGSAVSDELIIFFKKMSSLRTSKTFFSCFVKGMCGSFWSPEALFFVSHALANTPKCNCWGEKEVLEIKRFVAKAFKTHTKLIRCGVQCELLKSVMALINPKHVELENVILLLSCFSVLDLLPIDSDVWNKVVDWVKTTYSESKEEDILIKFTTGGFSNEFNEKSSALMLIILHLAYGNEQTSNVAIRLRDIILTFKDIDKRLYSEKSLHDNYLLIICYVLEKNVTCKKQEQSLFKHIRPFLKYVVTYVHSQVKCVSQLEDYQSCQLYIKTLENIFKIGNFTSEMKIALNDIRREVLETILNSDCHGSPIQIYCGMSLLKIMLENSFWNEEPLDSLYVYLTKFVKEPLEKEDDYSEKTKDVQTLWGRMNSEYLEAKWVMFEHLFNSRGFQNKDVTNGPTDDDLINLCTESLSIGGYGVLGPVMSVLQKVLVKWEDDTGIKTMVDSLWKLIMERRKTEEFKFLIKRFVETLFQTEIFIKGKVSQDIIIEYTNRIFADPSLTVVNIFVKHIQNMSITDDTISFFCHAVGQGLIFGPVQKKDEKLTVEVCSLIEFYNIYPVSDYNTSNEIRARVVQIILNLSRDSSTHKTFGVLLIDTLLELENGLNKNKTRYFGDSLVHRIKHRLMQALLLLDFFIFPNEEVAKKLSDWLYNSLMNENSQPSVKYQQEWLLVMILIRYDNLLNGFWDYFADSVEKKTKGICSLIAITYHLCKLVPSEATSSWIDRAIPTFLPFCMDQHFEMRLYAQVVLDKLCDLAKTRNLNDIVEKYKMISQVVLESIQRGCKGNAGKNCVKLQEDFYFTVFNPFEHYSLQTIYLDLPRLANVGSDELISSEMFEFCGVQSSKIYVPFASVNKSLKKVKCAKWVVERSHTGVCFQAVDSKDDSINYQKKMIPVKPVLPEIDDAFNNQNKEDGLIVVASLIDRIPNLGGLARTSEIFGAFEYVINSLKYTEDKQFTSLSVTAEKWITVKEVKAQNLSQYILEMKETGYTVIGAEQTLYSKPLSCVKFPKKSLLLLGNEKEGIPPNLLPLLDVCVEIPQVGIIRSLNVHVTGALFMWEYAKQNSFDYN